MYVSSNSQYAIMTMFAKIVNRGINEKLNNVKIILSSGVNAYTNDMTKAEGVEVLLKRIDGIEVEEMTGRCKWNVKVEPLSVRKIAFEYAISYPMKEKFVIE